jgi:hypothetical protein
MADFIHHVKTINKLFMEFLVYCGIDSISVNADAVISMGARRKHRTKNPARAIG